MTLTIAELALGGGILALSPMPGRGGAYLADLHDLLASGPALVMTMTTMEELVTKGAETLPADLARNGIVWLHLPIVDFGAPDAATAALWPEASNRAREVLSNGSKVLIHCMGGCGRSGMAALRLMVEAGEEPSAALKRLRGVRPCAVEMPEQYGWASAGGAEGAL